MAFVDELTLYAKAGNGGNGIVSWMREKYRPKGGPAGGNGGNGADVYFKAVRDVSRLADYTGNPKFVATKGGDGRRSSKEGASPEDLYVELPLGSVVTNKKTGESFQLLEEGETKLVLRGGRGGYGNEHFKSSVNTTPYEQTNGSEGEEAYFYVELQLVVDVGMVGLPSAGKSSLVNALTGSQMKEAEYPFTTLEPGLGAFHGYIIADIPGLIEGAAAGRGLGHKFLRHIKRTRGIAHLISFEYVDSEEGMFGVYQAIRKELEEYSPELLDKPELIILTKSDIASEETIKEQQVLFADKTKKTVISSSIIDDEAMEQTRAVFSNFIASLPAVGESKGEGQE